MVKQYLLNEINVFLAISLGLCSSSCMSPSNGIVEQISEGPYTLLVYPLTKKSGIQGIGYNSDRVCKEVGCGDLMLINYSGIINRVKIDGVVEERVSFSDDGRRVAYSVDGGIEGLHNGRRYSIKVDGSSPVVRYISIDNDGDIIYVNHQPIDDNSDHFNSLMYRGSEGGGHIYREPVDAVFYKCNSSLYAFSLGEIDKSNNYQYYPEYIFDRDGGFEQIRSGDKVSRDILGYKCNQDSSFDYVANVEGDIVFGQYHPELGFSDGGAKYEWDEFSSPSEGEPIIVEEDNVWALNTLGEMRVFDRHSLNYRVAWDMYRYFEKISTSEIGATSIHRDGSVFFFGIPKGRDKGWVMMEVEAKSGEIVRSVYLPSFDEFYPKGQFQGIYMGSASAFRKWADTQPTFDYSTMN